MAGKLGRLPAFLVASILILCCGFGHKPKLSLSFQD
jgi:hypothetical protein